jgi:hypothetical protein
LSNQLVSEFRSRAELVEALTCSCFVPAFSGYRTPLFRGRRYWDGGFTNNLPVLDIGSTVRVSPFSGPGKEICPQDIERLPVGRDDNAGREEKSQRSVRMACEDFYLSRANLQRLLHAGGAVNESQLASYYLAGYRDANSYFTRLTHKN